MSRSVPRPGASITVETPASSANLGPGFDSVGLALGGLGPLHRHGDRRAGVRVEVDRVRALGACRAMGPSGRSGRCIARGRRWVYRPRQACIWRVSTPSPWAWHGFVGDGNRHGHRCGAGDLDGEVTLRPHFDPGFTMILPHAWRASGQCLGLDLRWGHPVVVRRPGSGRRRCGWRPRGRRGCRLCSRAVVDGKARSVLPAHVRLADAAANSGRAALLAHALGHAPGTWWRPRGTGCTRSRAGPRMPLRWPWSMTCVGRVHRRHLWCRAECPGPRPRRASR